MWRAVQTANGKHQRAAGRLTEVRPEVEGVGARLMEDERFMEFFESLSCEIGEVKAEIGEVKAEMIARFEGMDRRLEHVENTTNSMLMQLAGVSKSLTAAERLDTAISVTQTAQQRAIDDLASRVTKIERKLNLNQSPK